MPNSAAHSSLHSPGHSSHGSSHGRISGTGSGMHGSSVHGHHRQSASPTEYFRSRIQNADRMENKVHDMNSFIYKGIDKFLDKQAVRDLIDEYDREDLYGEEGLDGENFIHGLDSDSEDELEVAKIMKEKDQAIDQIDGKFTKNPKGGQKAYGTRARPTLMDTFVGLIKVKLFNVHRRNSASRDIEALGIFNDNGPSSVSCFG